jgi:micrococcal nuclease
VRVIDGDTVDVAMNGSTERIRLIGVDTPETVDPRTGVQCFGREASDRAKALLPVGATVALEADPSQGERDNTSSRRLLRYLWMQDGRHFNLEMVREGYAHEYTYDSSYRYQAEFRAAERQAREEQRGLWSPATCGGNTKRTPPSTVAPSPAPPTARSAVATSPPPSTSTSAPVSTPTTRAAPTSTTTRPPSAVVPAASPTPAGPRVAFESVQGAGPIQRRV